MVQDVFGSRLMIQDVFGSRLQECGLSAAQMPLYESMLSKCSDWVATSTSDESSISQVLHRRRSIEVGDAAKAFRRAKAVNDTLEALTVSIPRYSHE